MDTDSRCRGNFGGVAGERLRAVARISSDDDPRVFRRRPLVGNETGEAGSRLSNDEAVHPRRPSPESAAKTGRAKDERVVEAVVQPGFILRLDERLELGTGSGVGIRRRPTPCSLD